MTWRAAWLMMVFAGCVVGVTPRASAEGFTDIYIGGAFSDASTNGVQQQPGFAYSLDTSSSSWEGGLRGGYWFGGRAKWVGLAADVSYFQPAHVNVDLGLGSFIVVDPIAVNVLAATPLLMLRLPLLAGPEFEGGRLQPYAAVGPGLFTSFVTQNSWTETDFDVGVDVRAGLAVMLIRHLGLFVEYRYTDFDVTITDAWGLGVESTLSTNHVNAGLALRF